MLPPDVIFASGRYCITSALSRYNYNMSTSKLSHLDAAGRARMVDVGNKPLTERVVIARGEVHMLPETLPLIRASALRDAITVGPAGEIWIERDYISHPGEST